MQLGAGSLPAPRPVRLPGEPGARSHCAGAAALPPVPRLVYSAGLGGVGQWA